MLTRERSFGWYCGTANRAQYSVLGQYFGQGEVCPNFLRADKGAETLFAGEAHLAMYVEAAVAPASTISTAVAITETLATPQDNGQANIGRNRAITVAAAARANNSPHRCAYS